VSGSCKYDDEPVGSVLTELLIKRAKHMEKSSKDLKYDIDENQFSGSRVI
jgi:hypothetical protein